MFNSDPDSGITPRKRFASPALPMPLMDADPSSNPLRGIEQPQPDGPPNPFEKALAMGSALGNTPPADSGAMPGKPKLGAPPAATDTTAPKLGAAPAASPDGSAAVAQGTPKLGASSSNAQEIPTQPGITRKPFFSAAERGIKNPVLRTLAEIGDVAGSSMFPGITNNIPGTRGAEHIAENRQLAQDKERAETGYKNAQTDALKAKPEKEENPEADAYAVLSDPNSTPEQKKAAQHALDAVKGAGKQDKPAIVHETDQGLILVHPDGTATPLTMNGKPVMGKKPAGNFEEQTYEEWHQSHPQGTRMQFDKERADNTRKPEGEAGTWQPMEQDGKAVLYNSKTGEVKAAPEGLAKPGTAAKADQKTAGAKTALAYATQYGASDAHTGPGDEALMEKFFELAKPETGFRMTQAQIDMLKNAQSWLGSLSAKTRHATVGTWFSDDQRGEIVQTMKDLAKANGLDEQGNKVPAGAGGDLKPPKAADPGMKWQHRTANGKTEWRQVPEK